MPGVRSLEATQYSAHPRNQFWPMIEAVLGIPADLPYAERCRLLTAKGVALWDVIGRCERDGSLDSAIRNDTLQPNDFARFFSAHQALAHVFFNGGKAEEVFRRHVLPPLGSESSRLRLVRLPSTSPAHAALRFAQKREAWREIARALEGRPASQG
jgi:hypoxanthine-DNA glycosylase